MQAATHGAIEEKWSPARWYLVASGIFLVVFASLGFLYDSSFPTEAAEVRRADPGYILGFAETNGWHNLNGIISGLLALGFALRPEWTRLGAFVKGSLYVAVTTSIAVWGPETFLIESNAADQLIHGSLAVAGIASALATPPRRRSSR